MADNLPPASPSTSTNHVSTTKVTDMDIDSLVHCASYLTLQDISNMALSCKYLNRVVYSDSIWRRLYSGRSRNPILFHKHHVQLQEKHIWDDILICSGLSSLTL
ncbi:unnamed protein product [Lactuca virosa]|uniref:F-box domain-containing protein n=1 Tax=Lactuca virosa TaxID=75947 RepID=A0AAU9NIS6_9ASTR|nr:unnamed protein product [Lactuca virosa]